MSIARRLSAALYCFLPFALLASGRVGHAQVSENLTPLLLAVPDAPVPFKGSDGSLHLVYELEMTNFSSAEIEIEKVEIVGDGVTLQTLDQEALAGRLQPAGLREPVGILAKSTNARLFLNVVLAPGVSAPATLAHRVTMRASAAPVGHQEFKQTGGAVQVDKQRVAQIGPPLRGDRYISADSCCDASRHTRAALPVNGRVWVAQRYAVDWEQLDAGGRIYAGPSEKLESYAIFGQPVLAVADAAVVTAVDGQPEQTPGSYPTNIPLDKADGNYVILDLGDHRFALYAHMQPGSLKVRRGEKVHQGQVIGLVGDSGNSIVPHLHFQVSNGPSSLSSNGLPYEVDAFRVTGKTAGTTAFDEAESKGTPLAITTISPPIRATHEMPLDQLIVSFEP